MNRTSHTCPFSRNSLREILHYKPHSGEWFWRCNRGPRLAGERAGCVDARGYLLIRINYVLYAAHRLAFIYMRDFDLPYGVDHADLDPSNGKWSNLRSATKQQNAANTYVRSDNSSGYKGVYWDAPRNKWHVCIGVKGRTVHLGRFADIAVAKKVYLAAAQKYFGEFAHSGNRT